MDTTMCKCPACGAIIISDTETKEVNCPYCGTNVSTVEYKEYKEAAEPEIRNAAEHDTGNPFIVYCKNCGAPAGYDISSQSYRCMHCGQKSGIQEAQKGFIRWRQLKSESLMTETTTNQQLSCPNCGAVVLFPKGEATNNCIFCGSTLIRDEFEHSTNFPEMIIPFVLTKEDALKQLKSWCKENKATPEAKAVMKNLNMLDGWYLPYQMIRGPVDVTVHRDAVQRIYHCDGYLEGSVVCTAENLDNMVLEAAEPFDPNGLIPFEHGYIAGHKARLQDISDFRTSERVMEEIGEGYRPYVEKVMQTRGCVLDLSSENLMSAPVLVPMYFIQTGELFAVVNGQTGKVAVSLERTKKQIIKLREPAILTAIVLAVSFWICRTQETFQNRVGLPLMITCVFGMIAFAAMRGEIKKKVTRIILSSSNSLAYREADELKITQGEDVFKNPFPNIPSFYEIINGVRTSVNIRFYPPVRVIGIIAKCVFLVLLPYLAAFLIKVIMLGAWAHPLIALGQLQLLSGAIWLIFMFAVIPAVYIKMYRQDAYNHPYIYIKEADGSMKLNGNAKDRRITLKGYMKILWKDEARKKIKMIYLLLGSAGVLSVLMLLFI